MKAIKYIFLILVLFSCSKKNNPIDVEDSNLYNVTFNAVESSQSLNIFRDGAVGSSGQKAALSKTNISTLKKYVPNLYFLVYNIDGAFVTKIVQDTLTYPDFGQVTFKLPAGKYRLVVLGTKDVGRVQHIVENENKYNTLSIGFKWNTPVDERYLGLLNPHNINHIFSNDNYEFEVSADSQFQSNFIVLKRVTSQLDLIIEDVIPNEFRYFLVQAQSSVPMYRPSNSYPGTLEHYFPYFINLSGYEGKSNVKLSIPLHFRPSLTKKHNISLYFGAIGTYLNPVPMIRRDVEVTFDRNKITQLNGKIFSTNSTTGNSFSVTIKESFDSTIYQEY